MKKMSKRGGGRRRMTPEQLKREAAIISDIKAGELSYRQIADKHSVSLPTVNNKARKAGISRGRRKGARIVVAGPSRGGARRKPGRPAGRTAARKTATRATARRVGRPATARRVGRPPMSAATSMPAMATMTRQAVRRGRPRSAARVQAGFVEAFRQLVLTHHPNMTVSRFDKLMRMVEDATR